MPPLFTREWCLLPGYPLEPHWMKGPVSPFRYLKAATLSPGTLLDQPVEYLFPPIDPVGVGAYVCLSVWLCSLKYSMWVLPSRSPSLCQPWPWLSVAVLCWTQERGCHCMGYQCLAQVRKGDGRAYAALLLSAPFSSLSNCGYIGAN